MTTPSVPDRHLPTAAELELLLGTLLDRPVKAKSEASKAGFGKSVVAVFAAADGEPSVGMLFDLAAAASAAAALTIVPATVVDESARVGQLSDTLMDNLLEVANVLSRLFVKTKWGKLRAQAIHKVPDDAPASVAAALRGSAPKAAFQVGISGYRDGHIIVMPLRT